jgi:hypothetical protein
MDTLIIENKEIRVHSGGIYARCFGRFSISTGMKEMQFQAEKH